MCFHLFSYTPTLKIEVSLSLAKDKNGKTIMKRESEEKTPSF